MPPHLHPRSTYTSSLFATSLFASFFIVALPHVLPCPVPHVAYADSNPNANAIPDGSETRPPRRRKRRCSNANSTGNEEEGMVSMGYEKEGITMRDSNGVIMMRKRECPVPKPPGLIGEILGLRSTGGSGGSNGSPSSSCNSGDDSRSS